MDKKIEKKRLKKISGLCPAIKTHTLSPPPHPFFGGAQAVIYKKPT
jgi:hypothetical protein